MLDSEHTDLITFEWETLKNLQLRSFGIETPIIDYFRGARLLENREWPMCLTFDDGRSMTIFEQGRNHLGSREILRLESLDDPTELACTFKEVNVFLS